MEYFSSNERMHSSVSDEACRERDDDNSIESSASNEYRCASHVHPLNPKSIYRVCLNKKIESEIFMISLRLELNT